MLAKYGVVKACPHCPEGRDSGEEESGIHWQTCQAYSKVRQVLDPEYSLNKSPAHQDGAGKISDK